ncbi:MAG: hypothetical protein IPF74_15770, partial [Rhodocyclaceae bacterium]|nr:hypothetical protein [Rhodocyclaceae bacterium]
MHLIGAGAIPAHDPMPPQHPHITQARHRQSRRWRDGVRVGKASISCRRKHGVKLVPPEAGQADVVTHAIKLDHFELEHFLIPPGIQRQAVVGDHIGAALRVGHVTEANTRDITQPELTRTKHATVASDNSAISVD